MYLSWVVTYLIPLPNTHFSDSSSRQEVNKAPVYLVLSRGCDNAKPYRWQKAGH
jgi:hypothetical protein